MVHAVHMAEMKKSIKFWSENLKRRGCCRSSSWLGE